MFASKYLQKHGTVACLSDPAEAGTGIIVVIPCIDEPDILLTLNSLNACYAPRCSVEVLVVINHSEASDDTVRQNNRRTKLEIDDWVSELKNERLKFLVIGPVEFKRKWAGAGLARKKGMDEAVCRFSSIGRPDGIIVSLDADTLVEKN
jgi:hypothetical protein